MMMMMMMMVEVGLLVALAVFVYKFSNTMRYFHQDQNNFTNSSSS